MSYDLHNWERRHQGLVYRFTLVFPFILTLIAISIRLVYLSWRYKTYHNCEFRELPKLAIDNLFEVKNRLIEWCKNLFRIRWQKIVIVALTLSVTIFALVILVETGYLQKIVKAFVNW